MSSNKRSNGDRRKLYRDTENSILGGVCAGIADYLDLDRWLVRIITITLLVFTNSLVFFLYIIAWLLMDKKPSGYIDDELEREFALLKLKRTFSGKNGSGDSVVRFNQLERRLQRLEAYLTSKQYNLRNEINNL